MENNQIVVLSNLLFELITATNQKLFNPSILIRKFSLPPSNIKVAFYLRKKGPVPVSQVSKDLDITMSNMTPIIDKLISLDLVTRYSDPNDRRINIVETTPKIKTFLSEIEDHMKQTIKDKLLSLQDEDFQDIEPAIREIIEFVNKIK